MEYKIEEATKSRECLFRVIYKKVPLSRDEQVKHGEVYILAEDIDHVLKNASRFVGLLGRLDTIEIDQVAIRVERIIRVE